MIEAPHILRLNIRHYQELLKLEVTARTRQLVTTLLIEAEAQLAITEGTAAAYRD